MKKFFYGLTGVVIILIIILVVKNYPEKGTFEEVVYSKYQDEDEFTSMEVYGDHENKKATNNDPIDEMTSYLKDIEIKENYLNRDVRGDSNKGFSIYLYNKNREGLYIHIYGKEVSISYFIANGDSHKKDAHKEYIITDEGFDIEKIEEIYKSLKSEEELDLGDKFVPKDFIIEDFSIDIEENNMVFRVNFNMSEELHSFLNENNLEYDLYVVYPDKIRGIIGSRTTEKITHNTIDDRLSYTVEFKEPIDDEDIEKIPEDRLGYKFIIANRYGDAIGVFDDLEILSQVIN